MIVGKQKPLDEVWEMIKDYNKVLVFGCNTCVAVCHEGGNKEAEIMGSMLRMKAKQEGSNIEITDSGIERQCEHEYFEQARERIEEADAVLSLACGAGVQFLGEKFPHKPVLPGLNTTFIGVVDEPGVFSERCLMCGDCILHLTGGVCPIARCSKSLLNGPCGGSENGKCEINPDVPCGWQLIYDRLKEQGRLELLDEVIPAKNWVSSRDGGPRKQVREDIMQTREEASDGQAE
ncbi:MAG: methylenetetrahydrofolate reductase C-terminal domain-containing protein [bacterium]